MTAPHRAIVLGGRGYYGARVVNALSSIDGLEVVVGSRADPDAGGIDLMRPETFDALDAFDLVVNASDSVNAPPDALARRCLERGLVLFEMGADSGTTERLLALDDESATGTVIVGVGIFPGISTALAADTAAQAGDPETIELGVRLSPLSGAGAGNCALMTEMMAHPSYRYDDHQRREGPVLGPPQTLTFHTAGLQTARQVALPDTALIHKSTKTPNVISYMSLSPNFFLFGFLLSSRVISMLGPLKPVALAMTRLNLLLLRSLLLRGVSSSVELTAVARGGKHHETLTRTILVKDGQEATALGVAAAVSCYLAGDRAAEPGVYASAELFALKDLNAAYDALGGEETISLGDG